MLSANLGWGRADFNWKEIEPTTKGAFVWEQMDALVAAANVTGSKVLAILGYTPAWARSGGTDKTPPTNDSDYADFCAAVAARYYPQGVTHYEIWNEANINTFFANVDTTKYASMLQAAYTAIKTVAPGATVLFSGLTLATTTENDTNHKSPNIFLQQVYDAIGSGYFDQMNYHPYSWSDTVIASIYSVMCANGDIDKKIWFTEYGRPTGGTAGQDFVDEATQAQQLVRAIRRKRQIDYAGPLFFYEYLDSAGSQPDREG